MEQMGEEFVKKRLEKDLQELKRMIETHFQQRKRDEEELSELKDRIEKRKQMREEQLQLRAEREKARQEAEKLERERRLAEETARKEAEELKKKEGMQALAASFGGYKQQARQRTGRGERDRKKKYLAERRKPLNIDHLAADKLTEKITELYNHLITIETGRCECEQKQDPAKYFVTVNRVRVNMVMSKMSKRKK